MRGDGAAMASATPAVKHRAVAAPPQPKRHAAPETLRLYAAEWTSFENWCAATGRSSLPADAATVAAFLAEGAATLSIGALVGRARAIGAKHRQRGLVSPAVDPTVKAVLRAARHNAPPRRGMGPDPARLMRMAAACPGDRTGLRDRAMLLLMACGRLGPADLVGLDAEQIRFAATSVELTVDAAGTAGEWLGRLSVPCGANPSLCPAQALRDWLRASDTQCGPVFRKIDRWGNIDPRRLAINSISRILSRRTPHRARRRRKPTAA